MLQMREDIVGVCIIAELATCAVQCDKKQQYSLLSHCTTYVGKQQFDTEKDALF